MCIISYETNRFGKEDLSFAKLKNRLEKKLSVSSVKVEKMLNRALFKRPNKTFSYRQRIGKCQISWESGAIKKEKKQGLKRTQQIKRMQANLQ